MVNIWEYAGDQPDIQLVTVNGERYVGYVYMVFDAEEANDVEDVLALSVDGGRIRHFHPSEIAKIIRIE